jgi:hypothetical protein
MATAAWIIVVSAHGSVHFSQGKSGENADYILSGRYSKREPDKDSKSAPEPRTRPQRRPIEKSALEEASREGNATKKIKGRKQI